ncbi:hypothetical protein QVZ41_08960 [Wenyingzhuangia sp. chi5]|uniref:Spore cortex biosynthesis protein YabQ n=1 Tax=Wenyingzhuangia gilva TaxID=3057677 RepID=A0ABT8VSM0_9FLAO|nr:hypothetical protein [Wenyingzhuangia sp. chi5]MDO3694970.1 hypothetical protein [Wenyingzhuangia sp. chi5]
MKKEKKKYLQRKLIYRLRILTFIFLGMSAIGFYDIYAWELPVYKCILYFLGGMGLGFFIGRMHRIVWNEEVGQAVSKMDVFGILILIFYILIVVFKKHFFSHWLAGHQLSTYVMWFSAGIIVGRMITLRMKIKKVLKNQGIF